MNMTDLNTRKRVHVAVGVIRSRDGRILVARRSANQHLGGLWEFPGGKVEAGETVNQALARELHEELGIDVQAQSALCCIQHDYSDKSVLLDVWIVNAFSGTAQGKEGQPLRWLFPHELEHTDFPQANRAIIRALQLPDFIALLDTNSELPPAPLTEFLQKLPASALLRLRNPSVEFLCVPPSESQLAFLSNHGQRLIIDMPADHGAHGPHNLHPQWVSAVCGVHANRHVLKTLRSRPVADHQLFGASCHNAEELMRAQVVGADYVLLSPVKETASHPGKAGMGWETFMQLAKSTSTAVYAMGGLSLSDLPHAQHHGARGIAGMRLFNAWLTAEFDAD
jgi:8-oxo-dGTP diphosphatase